MPLRRTIGRWHLAGLAVAATACAAGLVLYLQHRAISALRSQTEITLRQISEQGAADVATELRRVLDGPVFDTLTAVNHPELRDGRLDLVGEQFRAGLTAYPQVDQFFAWHSRDGPRHDAVLFYGRRGQFGPDPELGHAVMSLAYEYAPAQQIYVASPIHAEQQVFVRLFWTDATRREFFAILGFVIDATRLRERLFGAELVPSLEHVLRRRGGEIPLRLSVTDERGVVLYGDGRTGPMTTRVPFPLVFYPRDEIHSRLAASIEPRPWTIAVSAGAAPQATRFEWHGYALTAVSLAFMAVAVVVTLQAHRRLVELEQMQADFIAHVSHQLKTPLSLLRAAVDTLRMNRVRSRERLAEYLTTIDHEAARLSALVHRVLEFSRLQQQRSYEFERVDLGRLVHETVDAFASGFMHRRFECDFEGCGAGPYVHADPAALEQVLANLLDNAVKYSEPHTPVLIRLASLRHRVVLEVIDRGIGVARVDHARIFERFYRAANGASRPGFGLGLTIVSELVLAHGGSISVRSSFGHGSTFRVTLPLDLAPATTAAPGVNASEARP